MCGIAVYTGNQELVKQKISDSFIKIKHRGPDTTRTIDLKEAGWIGFHRLSIIDLSSSGDQPFHRNQNYLVCNGEIFNHRTLKAALANSWQFASNSDCEVILPLIEKLGIESTCQVLDGEFAFVVYNAEKDNYFAGRDPIGIRPLFYGQDEFGKYCFASEMKVLHNVCKEVKAFPPGHFFDGERFMCYQDITSVSSYFKDGEETLFKGIRIHLIEAVKKRLESDQEVGFLLSGGLDSSLVCAIAARHSSSPIKTFAIGIEEDPIDTKYARIVANHIGSDHTEVLFTKKEVEDVFEEVIYLLETYDVTTIRASVGMYLLSKYIRDKTDVRVLLTGEVSDELFGYKYTDFAPDANEFQKEAIKRVKELYMYDVLRADRCIAGASLEARVPFGDKALVQYVMHIDPRLKMNTTGIGKYLLRKSFDTDEYLPKEILWREKAAFSDAVGHSMVDYLKELADLKYSNEEFEERASAYPTVTPISKEALMYREVFEEFYSKRSSLINGYWMPNKSWENCQVDDPSARVLPNYGQSGV